MIVAKFGDTWCLAGKRNLEVPGCSLVFPEKGDRPSCLGNRVSMHVDSFNEIVFFPESRYNGMPLFPQSWDRNVERHRLFVFINFWDFHAKYPDLDHYDAWKFHAIPGLEAKSEGRNVYDRLQGYIEMNDPNLELIEGPPPEGKF